MKILGLIRWQDILDILIVTVIIYRGLLIIKGTRAAQMLVGLGVLFLALVFATALLNSLKYPAEVRLASSIRLSLTEVA